MGVDGEPKLRRFYLVALRDAARDLWGEAGVQAILARMPHLEREEARDEARLEWIPERVIIAWGLATWEGPAARDRAVLNRFLARHVDHGFGRLRRVLLRFAPPATFFENVPRYWRHDHTHGVLETQVDGRLGVVHLRDHPYVESPQSRAAIAEIFRYTVQSMRAKNVTEVHTVESDGAMSIRVRWD